MGTLFRHIVSGLAGLLLVTAAAAEDRLALVIGINAYQELAPLQKARADAEAVAKALGQLGFAVDSVLDADRRAFNRAISNFVHKITPGATVYVHYSGHGVEIDNDTYLLPADIPVPRVGDKEFVKREALRLSELLEMLKGASAKARILSIDACRDNPFAQKGTRSIGTSRGIAVLPAPRGSLIMYSAAQGQAALDQLGPDDREATSVYTRVLLKHLGRSGVSITDVAQEVRREVEAMAAQIGHEQRPAYYDELSDRLFLAGLAGGPQALAPPPPPVKEVPRAPPLPDVPPPSPSPRPDRTDREAWETIKDTNSAAVLRAFAKRFSNSVYADLARARVADLERAVPPKPRPAPEPAVRDVVRPEAEAPSGNWLVVIGSYKPAERWKADERLASLRSAGVAARIVNTRAFSNLTPGLVAVVWGPVSRAAAERHLGRAQRVARDAYIKEAN